MNLRPDFFTILKWSGFPVKSAQTLYQSLSLIDDVPTWQLSQRDRILEFHLQNNPFYRKHAGDFSGKWEDLPILRKSDLRGDCNSKLPTVHNRYYRLSTSGSSGHPLLIARDRLTHVLVWLNAASHYHKAGVEMEDLQARFYGIPLSGMAHYKELLKDFITNRVRFPVFDLSDSILLKWLNRFKKKKFVYLYGYTNSLVAFSAYLVQQGVVLKQVCPTLKVCIVTAEVCSDEDKHILEKGFGVPVFNEFGASEVSVIGFKGEGHWEVSDEVVYVEVVDESGNIVPDGTVGRLLCTMLHNQGTPIIRYEIGDMAAIERRNGKTYITKLSGRLSDTVILPSGKKVPGLTFYYVARQLLNKCKDIDEFRVVQTGVKDFELEVVSPKVSADFILPLVKKGFLEYLEPGLNVSVRKVDVIERTETGKFKHFLKSPKL